MRICSWTDDIHNFWQVWPVKRVWWFLHRTLLGTSRKHLPKEFGPQLSCQPLLWFKWDKTCWHKCWVSSLAWFIVVLLSLIKHGGQLLILNVRASDLIVRPYRTSPHLMLHFLRPSIPVRAFCHSFSSLEFNLILCFPLLTLLFDSHFCLQQSHKPLQVFLAGFWAD